MKERDIQTIFGKNNKKNNIKIMGIDPGSNGAGFSYFEDDKYIFSIQSNFSKKFDFYDRIKEFKKECKKNLVLADVYAIEMPFARFNINTTIKLSLVRGICISEILEINPKAHIIDVTPIRVRQILKLKKGAKKIDIHKLVESKYEISQYVGNKRYEDMLDSIAIAIVGKQLYDNTKIVKNNNW